MWTFHFFLIYFFIPLDCWKQVLGLIKKLKNKKNYIKGRKTAVDVKQHV